MPQRAVSRTAGGVRPPRPEPLVGASRQSGKAGHLAVVAWLCLAIPGSQAQTAVLPSSTLFTVGQGTLTLYTTFNLWTGYWNSSTTLRAGKDKSCQLATPGLHVMTEQQCAGLIS